MGNKAKVYVLYTGGTFGMAAGGQNGDGPLEPLPLEQLQAFLPPSDRVMPDIEVVVESLEPVLDSSSMQPLDWLAIAQKIKLNYQRFDGFVIIHGTDTLAYTASALSFIFENLAKPVVVTGSQMPLLAPGTDATDNFWLALQTAAFPVYDGQPLGEVVVAFSGVILRGNRCRKISASNRSAFASPNCKPLGMMRDRLWIDRDMLRHPAQWGGALAINEPLETGVIDLALFPGITPRFIARVLDDDGLRGLVLRTYGSGNAPGAAEFLAALKQGLEKRRITAVAVSQCQHGAVQFGRYAASTGLADCGVIPGDDMTPEAALAKLMVLLPQIGSVEERRLLVKNLRGEISGCADVAG